MLSLDPDNGQAATYLSRRANPHNPLLPSGDAFWLS